MDIVFDIYTLLLLEHQAKLHSTLSTFGKIDGTIKGIRLRMGGAVMCHTFR